MSAGPPRFRYLQIAQQVARTIEAGALRPGDRLPSVRRLSREREVSVATAVATYVHLESRGLVEARPRSGYYVRRRAPAAAVAAARPRAQAAPPVVPAVAPAILRLVQSMRDPTVVPLGTGTIAPELLPARALNRTLAAIARESAGAGATYAPAAGVPTLQRQLAARSLAWGTSIAPDGFIVTHGAMEALHVALRATTHAGDVVAVEAPAFFGTLQAIQDLARSALEIPCHPETGMDLDALEAQLGRHPVRAVVASPNFQNPLGSRMPDANKERLVRLCARHDVALIEDDLYGDLAFDGARPVAAQAFDRQGRVLLVGSVSKTLAPGYRVGWLAPGRYQERALHLKFAQTLATSTLPQMAVAEYLASGRYDRHLRGLRARLLEQVRAFRQAVLSAFPAGTRASSPQGGFFLWVEMPAGVDAAILQEQALARRVAVAPGPMFSARARFRRFLRLSCGLPFSPQAAAAVATLGNLAHRQLA